MGGCRRFFLAILVWATAAALALAGDKPLVERPIFTILVQQSATDNIFREEEAKGVTRDTFTTLGLEVEPTFRLPNGWRLTPGLNVQRIIYGDTEAADHTDAEASLEWRLKETRAALSYFISPERLLFFKDVPVDPNDPSGPRRLEEVLYRTEAWGFRWQRNLGERGLFDSRLRRQKQEFMEPPSERDRTNITYQLRASFSIKAAEAFRPRLGLRYDDRDAEDENHSYRRGGAEIGAEGTLAAHLRYLTRFDYARSDYLGDDPSGSNFEREDTRREARAELQFPVKGGLAFRLGGLRVFADSTRADRNFTATEGWLAAMWSF